VLTLLINVAIMTAALYVVLAWVDWSTPEGVKAAWEAPALDPALGKAVALVLLQLAVITAIALLFSTFSSPLLSAALTFGLFIVGHFNADLRNFEAVVESPAVAAVARALYYVLPNLAPFDVKAQVVHGQPVPLGYLALTSAYGVTYIAALLVLAIWIFSRRDFK
jgi:ABC-type transport system involved in multi-copper enzyme maturation permease subunit